MDAEPEVPRFRSVVLDGPDARALAEFYRQLLGLAYEPGDEPPPTGQDDPRGRDWVTLAATAHSPRLAFQQVERLAQATWPTGPIPQQLHLDFSVATPEELHVQHQRATALGARLLEDRSTDPDEPLYVYADPAGHPFCVFVLAAGA